MSDNSQFVSWFRQCSPYIHAHRGKTFVVYLGGEVFESEISPTILHDIALLSSLGVRLVLVFGVRPQLNQRLETAGINSQFHNGIRITEQSIIPYLKAVVGETRIEIESILSMGLANSPMQGAKIRVSSGNVVVAKPLGVRDGVDYHHTGQIRRLDNHAIEQHLSQGHIALISPMGYSPTGELFNMDSIAVAAEVAVRLAADKLVLLGDVCAFRDEQGQPMRELSLKDTNTYIPPTSYQYLVPEILNAAKNGVKRVHLLDHRVDGALMLELFTRDGIGTLIADDGYETLRGANTDDLGGILALIQPLEVLGVLVRRSRELIEAEISRYSVIERDGMIIACAALHHFPDEHVGELACLAVHPDYRRCERGDKLLKHIEQQASSLGLQRLVLLSTQTSHWFKERGFIETSIQSLPLNRQSLYNYQRKSKIFVKPLG